VRDLTVEGAGVDEVAVSPWPLMVHRRISRRLSTGRATNRWTVVVVALSGLAAVSISITVLSVVLTDIAVDLNSTTSTLSWTILGPMLAFGVVSPVYGKAGDMFGHKRVFVLAAGRSDLRCRLRHGLERTDPDPVPHAVGHCRFSDRPVVVGHDHPALRG
jgi:hypothetical protein